MQVDALRLPVVGQRVEHVRLRQVRRYAADVLRKRLIAHLRSGGHLKLARVEVPIVTRTRRADEASRDVRRRHHVCRDMPAGEHRAPVPFALRGLGVGYANRAALDFHHLRRFRSNERV